ncbi:hypothetical protein CABS03_10111 [Colletotrichum abscissum]|uniref:Zn(2)-C6 fungal-type domain-containing protein n=2 Tax=Colletotrichum abscissum TaxID=1671311 RepID=A0A9P9XDI8_9PEZI|nr:hypothetical protein CABS02_08501 [Colletotrichum abscissum]KAK1702209.1 fungal-specific transcription factor domain-containing protein [Colletotrichum lupini]
MTNSRNAAAVASSKKRCGTCIDRKVSCDRRFPRCTNCIKSNRKCQGYGLRLSWPRATDGKRSLISRAALFPRVNNTSGRLHMINATSWDIEVHNFLIARRMIRPIMKYPLPWSSSGSNATDQSLFRFFRETLRPNLSSFSSQPLGEVLLRIALSEISHAGKALQHALLAFSAQYRYGPVFRAEELKLSALRALSLSAAEGMSAHKAVQHVAAGMVLCMFETQKSSHSTNHWLCYLRSSRTLIESVSLEKFWRVSDAPMLLEWVSYHEILARFSLRHWRKPKALLPSQVICDTRPFTSPEMRKKARVELSMIMGQASLESKRFFQPLGLLSEVVAEILPSDNPETHTQEYRCKIRTLKAEIESLRVTASYSRADLKSERIAAKSEVYRLSTLVYLSRTTDQGEREDSGVAALVERGLQLLPLMGTCERPLPLLIFGCEARTDEERLRILNLVSNAEKTLPDRELHSIKKLLHALWTQDDLHADNILKPTYIEKLSAVFSASELLPHFA